MAILKMQMPDDNRRKNTRVSSTGAPGKKKSPRYTHGDTAHSPITRNSQYAGSGASVTMTQPMFFSPMHTPQNWQIASKRREIYQWCFLPDTLITMSDGSQKEISSLKAGDEVISHLGKARKITKVFKRKIDEDINCLSFSGISRNLRCTMGHKIRSFAKKPSYISCNSSLLSMQKNKEDFFEQSKYVQAGHLRKGDIVFSPKIDKSDQTNIKQVFFSNEEAFLFGLYLAEGSICWYKYKNNKKPKGIRLCISSDEASLLEKIHQCCNKLNLKLNAYKNNPKGNKSLDIHIYNTDISSKFVSLGGCGARTKKLSKEVINEREDILNEIISGFVSGDGHIIKRTQNIDITTSSKDLAYQFSIICNTLNICNNIYEFPVSGYKHFHYKLVLSSDNVKFDIIKKSYTSKLENKKLKTSIPNKSAICRKIKSNDIIHYSGEVYDLEVEEEHSYIAEGISVSNSRFYYENEPKVAAGVDFYSNFPMNGFTLECPNSKILEYYDHVVEKLELNQWLNYISHEYFLLGDVFPFLEINCPVCGGSGVDENGERCNHAGGSFSSIRVMNPDYVEVQDNVLAKEPVIAMLPDEELKMIVQRKQPRQIYDNLPQWLVDFVASGQPIPLSPRSVSHLKFNSAPYSTYGNSMLRRLFTILAYKTKLMTANWIVAERMILPIRVVKVGEKDRPATEEDIQDVVNQLAAVANDPNLTIVTHHAFEYNWHGATGKIHNLNNEMEQIGKEILDGLMLNQAILNGEMAGYSCHDEETMFLDKHRGWTSINEVIHEELEDLEILVFDPKTKTTRYEKPFKKHVYDYEGDMIDIEGTKFSISVTPNHKMLVYKRDKETYRVLEANEFVEINECDRYLRSISNYDGEDIKEIEIGDYKLNINDFAELAGYFISEGSVSYDEKRRNYRISIPQCPVSNPVICNNIQDLFERMNIPFKKYEYENRSTTWVILNKKVAKYFKDVFGSNSNNKRIPQVLKNSNKEILDKLIYAYCDGDASWHEYKNTKSVQLGTKSKQLAEDLLEVLFKSGRSPVLSQFIKKSKDCEQYVVNCCLEGIGKGSMPRVKDKNISKRQYKGKVWCFETSTGFFVTQRRGRITIQGNSAQVGVEIMIRRLENWRNKLKDWIEQKIFKPIAMMQGFVDEGKSKKLGRTEYIYPKVKFNEMNLRDNTNKIQLLLQLYDKQGVSMQTILEELNLDYDSEIEKMRQENVVASASGMMPAGGQDPMGGGGLMGGPMGGGGPMGDDMGADPMADPMMGGMPEGMPGGDQPPGMMPPGAPDMAAAAQQPMKVTKKGKTGDAQQPEVAPPKTMKLTKLESTLYSELANFDVPFKLFGQYQVKLPGEKQPFILDFAYPEIGVAIESDGAIWHERSDLKQRDALRDKKLSNVGWRVIRFSEQAIYEHMDAVRDVIYKNIVEAAKSRKKTANTSSPTMEKYASQEELYINPKDLVQDIAKLSEGEGSIIVNADSKNESFYLDYLHYLDSDDV